MTELILQKDGAPQPLEPLIYDLGSPGRVGITLPAPDVPLADLYALLRRHGAVVPGEIRLDQEPGQESV